RCPRPSVATRGTHRGNGEADEIALDIGAHAGTVEIRDVITPVHGEEVTLAQLAGQTDRPSVRRGGILCGADDDDRWGTRRGRGSRRSGGRHGPHGTPRLSPRQERTKHWGRLREDGRQLSVRC